MPPNPNLFMIDYPIDIIPGTQSRIDHIILKYIPYQLPNVSIVCLNFHLYIHNSNLLSLFIWRVDMHIVKGLISLLLAVMAFSLITFSCSWLQEDDLKPRQSLKKNSSNKRKKEHREQKYLSCLSLIWCNCLLLFVTTKLKKNKMIVPP